MVEGADEVLAGGEVDAGLAAEGRVDLGEEGGGQADVADAAHVDGGEEAGDVADDAAAEGEEDGVAVGAGEGELLGEGFDLGEALVALAGGEEEGGGLLVCWEGGEEGFVPEGPDVGRGDDEEFGGFVGGEFAEAGVEGAEKAGGDGDVVGGLRGGDGDGGHGGYGIAGHVGAVVDARVKAKRATLAGAVREPLGMRAVDFLVVGGGIAGLRAAAGLADAGSVLVVTKEGLGESNTAYAQGGIAVAMGGEEDVALHLADTVAAGDGLVNAAAAAVLVEQGPRRVEELLAWGTGFDRYARCELMRTREGAHSVLADPACAWGCDRAGDCGVAAAACARVGECRVAGVGDNG